MIKRYAKHNYHIGALPESVFFRRFCWGCKSPQPTAKGKIINRKFYCRSCACP